MDWKAWLVTAVVTGLGTVAVAIGTRVYAWLRTKAVSAGATFALNSLYIIVQSAVAHANVEIKPELTSIASNALNGRLSASDASSLKASVMRMVKDMASDLLPKLEQYLGLSAGSRLDTLISGMIEKAVLELGATAPAAAPATVASDPIAESIAKAAKTAAALTGAGMTKVMVPAPKVP